MQQEGLFFISTEKYRKKEICVNFTIQRLVVERCLANRAKAVKTRCAKTGLIDMLPIFQYRFDMTTYQQTKDVVQRKRGGVPQKNRVKKFSFMLRKLTFTTGNSQFLNSLDRTTIVLDKTYSFERLYLVMTLGSVFNANLKICNIKGTQ